MPRDTCAEETLKGASHAALQGSGVDSTEILRSNGFAPRRASDPVSLSEDPPNDSTFYWYRSGRKYLLVD